MLGGCGNRAAKQQTEEGNKWIERFNGENREGWTIKITGYPVGENFGKTFRVEDGLRKVRYDQYDEFGGRFGHIYTDQTFSDYILRLEYRFVGEQPPGGPGWAYRNNGDMLHCPSPENMHPDQTFPVSIEAQILGGNGTDERTTGNVCTPGTEIDIDGKPYTDHCYNSHSKTYHGDQWVTMDIVVWGDSIVHHIIEGDTVLTYTNLRIGGGGVDPDPGIAPVPLKEGHIALQAESAPIDFRKVDIVELER